MHTVTGNGFQLILVRKLGVVLGDCHNLALIRNQCNALTVRTIKFQCLGISLKKFLVLSVFTMKCSGRNNTNKEETLKESVELSC